MDTLIFILVLAFSVRGICLSMRCICLDRRAIRALDEMDVALDGLYTSVTGSAEWQSHLAQFNAAGERHRELIAECDEWWRSFTCRQLWPKRLT